MKKTTTCFLILAFIALCNQAFPQKTQSERADSIDSKREANLPLRTLNVNLVGVALYGPIIQMEFKVANRAYLAPWIRYSYAGVVSQYQWTNFEDDSQYDPSSVAIGLGFKIFKPGDKKDQLVYYGFFGEYMHESGLSNMDSDYEYEQTRDAVALYFNLGYRWKFTRNFYMSIGILPGVAYDLKNEASFTNSGGPYPGVEKEIRFIGMLDVNFGWNLER